MHAYLGTAGDDLAPEGPSSSGPPLPALPASRAYLPPLDADLDLDWFAVDPLLFDDGLVDQPPPGGGRGGQAGAAAAPQAVPAALHTHTTGAALRCLDPSHADGCTRCVPGPRGLRG